MKAITKKILSAIVLIALGVGGRIFFVNYIGIPNLEVVSSFALLSGFYLGGVFSFIVPLAIIFLSDLFIGNNAILLFTWSAFGIIGLMGIALRKKATKLTRLLLWSGGAGVVASCFFFLYTNFGWWVLSGMYPHTWGGLFACYVNALLFFRNNLLGNLVLVPLVFGVFFVVKNLNYKLIKKYDFIRQRH
ncbi:MAG: hypothetical protein PHY72_00255 [Candidatus Pacebacteria bacterium]|nr:hypothetical protein [Candidatus Paceibacterota bacterium]